MKKLFCLLILILAYSSLYSQKEGYTPSIEFSGFVKTDIFYDTRQNEELREGHFLILPLNEKLDANGKDLNKTPMFNILSVQTRLIGKIPGPEVLGAKTSGYIEGEFFGTSNADINGFRLRHAYVDFDWGSTKIRVGQFWHPMFITDCFPGVISFNTGAPFQPFSRNPQVRLTQQFDNFFLSFAAVTQRDFQSTGPEGASSKYLRQALIPDLNLQAMYKDKSLLVGAGGQFKRLVPRINDANNIAVDEFINSYSAMAYFKITQGDFQAKIEGIYGNNLSNMTMMGGYAIKEETLNSDGGTVYSYTNNNWATGWIELIYGKEVEFAIFAGYAKNFGVENDINFSSYTYYGRGKDVDFIYRISPRIALNLSKIKIGFEAEYTSADYGTPDPTDKYKVKNTKSIANLRGLIGVFIFF